MFYSHQLNVSAKLSYEQQQYFSSYRTTVCFRLQHAVPLPSTTVLTEKLAALHGELHQRNDFRYRRWWLWRLLLLGCLPVGLECMYGRFGGILFTHIHYFNRNNVLLHLGHRSHVTTSKREEGEDSNLTRSLCTHLPH
jgi:hypothetical protein